MKSRWLLNKQVITRYAPGTTNQQSIARSDGASAAVNKQISYLGPYSNVSQE